MKNTSPLQFKIYKFPIKYQEKNKNLHSQTKTLQAD